MRRAKPIGVLLLLWLFLLLGNAQAQQVSSDLVYGVLGDHGRTVLLPHHITPQLQIPEGFERIQHKIERLEPAQIGQKESFFVRNILALDTWYSLQAECLYTSNYLSIWIDSELKTTIQDSISIEEVLPELIQYLEHRTSPLSIDSGSGSIPIIHHWFGMPPNINGNGVVDILLLDIPDMFESTGSYVAGFFDPVNLTDFEFSNRRDMVYVDVFPSLFYRGVVRVRDVAATITHEYQHLIQMNYEKDGPLSVFLNEGLSELAEIISGFEPREASSYLNDPSRSLLGWAYSNPLSDYSRASLFTHYMFEQIGYEHIWKLVQTRKTGYNALDELLNENGSTTLESIFTNWGKALLLNDITLSPQWGYRHPSRQGFRFTNGVSLKNVPDFLSASLPPFSHGLLSFPLTQRVDLTFVEAPKVNFTARATFPDGSMLFLGNASTFEASTKSHGSISLLASNTGNQQSPVSFIAEGTKSGQIKTLAYDDGIPDSFHDNASYLLLNQPTDAVAIRFESGGPAWLYEVSVKAIFMSEILGSGIPTSAPRQLTVQIRSSVDGRPGSAITEPLEWTVRRPVGNLRFESIDLMESYPELSYLTEPFFVQISGDMSNKMAIGMDDNGYERSFIQREQDPNWKPFSEHEISGKQMSGWNPMIRADIVSPNPVVAVHPQPDVNYDLQSVRVEIPHDGQLTSEHSRLFSKLPTGRIVNGILKGTDPNLLTYDFPIEVGGHYVFYSNLSDPVANTVSQKIWEWEIPENEGFQLGSNFPNPFNPSTTLPFLLLESADIRVHVYDSIGRSVLLIPTTSYEAGSHQVSLDFSNLASGLYLVNVDVNRPDGRGHTQRTKKVIYMK